MHLDFIPDVKKNNNWFVAQVFQTLEEEILHSLTSEVGSYFSYTAFVTDEGS